MSFLVTAKNRRAREWDFTINEDGGSPEIGLAADDVVRVKIGTNEAVPILDLSSLEATEITFTPATGDCVLYLDAADVAALGAGAHDIEVNVYDLSENKLKHAESGVFFVHPSQLGETADNEESSNSSSSTSESS